MPTPMILALLLQVGPNPAVSDPLGLPDELANRPPRAAPAPEHNPVSQWLSTCLDLIETDASRAHTAAQIRRNETEGAERVVANHCLGLAATELGLWADARTAFLAARDETPADQSSARARFALMAGNAALGAKDVVNAVEILAEARDLARQSASTTLEAIAATDHARALVSAEREEDALAALELATTLEPGLVEGWLLRATLLRRMDRLEAARAAIAQAQGLAPQALEITLEAGLIAALQGRDAAARESWQSIVTAQPDSLAGQRAAAYLDQLGPAASETGE